MADTKCRHEWSIINVRNGFLVTEGCMATGERANFFTLEDNPHKDTYVVDGNLWRFLGNSQAVKFDLQCKKCGTVLKLDKTQAMAMVIECTDECRAAVYDQGLDPDTTWVYTAMCTEVSHKNGECVPNEETRALTEYFNGRIKSRGKKVVFVPCILLGGIDRCQAEIIADVGLKDID